MIRLFRKIRQKLLSESSYGIYILYASGEIILVVVGILVAFQIDNWNEIRKLKSDEISMLKNFSESIRDDLQNFEWPLEINPRVSNSTKVIIESIEKDLPYHDSLSNHFRSTVYLYARDINESVFEALKSNGLSLISNEQLRFHIISLYGAGNTTYKALKNRYAEMILDASENLYNTRFQQFWGDTDMIPLDFEKLKIDQEYLYFIRTQKTKHGIWMLRNLNIMHESLVALLKEIEIEIENLEK